NSIRSVRLAIDYEIERQARLLDAGERVEQITVGWDEDARRTVYQRSKEGSEDYRYFPEPDLPPLEWDAAYLTELKAGLPELPQAREGRLVTELGIKESDAALLVADRVIADYFERAVTAAEGQVGAQTVANWVVGEVFRLLSESGSEIGEARLSPEGLVELLRLIADGTINQTVAKEVLTEMFASGQSARAIVERRGLTQISDADALAQIIGGVLDANPGPVGQYLEGETKVVGFFIGQVMRATQGQANVQVVRQLLTEALEKRRR
ncbi:MAG: Asp-tRNA(Asn)/Glu-tRNA(Gln) amidotransferase GatCAB subunit B, partial [Anaerolineae bacterium]|nr:Asp-tRNA(Asn)/Glu-tRNA(Gln) amidotransferase GatCAB subunit B [Anaerolineae bacterium]